MLNVMLLNKGLLFKFTFLILLMSILQNCSSPKTVTIDDVNLGNQLSFPINATVSINIDEQERLKKYEAGFLELNEGLHMQSAAISVFSKVFTNVVIDMPPDEVDFSVNIFGNLDLNKMTAAYNTKAYVTVSSGLFNYKKLFSETGKESDIWGQHEVAIENSYKAAFLKIIKKMAADKKLVAYLKGDFKHNNKQHVADYGTSLPPDSLHKNEAYIKDNNEKDLSSIPANLLSMGKYYALVIGNNSYQKIESLITPVNDANDIDSVLAKEYNFKVAVLHNATRYEILSKLNDYRKKLTKRDNLLIYYAGHGWLDKETGEGYWLPVDSEADNPANWVANSSITNVLKSMEAKHVMIVSDSCYSGTLTRNVKIRIRHSDHLQRIARKRARTVIASGGIEPVADTGGKGTHSVFATAFIEALKKNEKNVVETSELFTEIRRNVILNADQTPEYSDIRKAGHDGGEFLFVKVR